MAALVRLGAGLLLAGCVACAQPTKTPTTKSAPASAPAPAAAPEAAPEPAPESTAAPAFQMAITVDDLPVHGPLPKGVTRLEVHQQMLKVLLAHKVPQVYGFANLARVQGDAARQAALRAWVDAGYPLGNHSYAHEHMRDIGVEAYLEAIDANEAGLERLNAPGTDWHVYRYPYLEEGDTGAEARRVRAHLAAKGYRVAEVTVDFYDWAFNPPYARCLAAGDDAAVAKLRARFLEHAAFTLGWADDAAQQLFGRRIPHVLLLHVGAFDAVMLDELLTRYEAMGVQFISLDTALSDPVYEIVEIPESGVGGTLLEHLISTRDAPHPPWFTQPYKELKAMCR